MLLALIPVLNGCQIIRPGFVREDTIVFEGETDNEVVDGVEGPTGGHFDEEGNWVPDNEEIPSTYKIPDIGAGFIFDANSLDASPSLQIELLEMDTRIPYIRTLKLDAGVAYQRAFIYVGKLFTSIFEISAGGFVGWNWEDNKLSYGIGVTVIRF